MLLINPTEDIDKVLGHEGTIDFLKNAGFDAIDMTFTGLFADGHVNSVFRHDGYREYALQLRQLAESKGMSYRQAHAPYPSSKGNEEFDAMAYGMIVRSMEVASLLGIPRIVVHPLQHLNYANNREKLFEMNVAFYRSLIPYCEKFGIQVCCENMWHWDDRRHIIIESVCARPEEFVELLETIDSPWIGGCLDIGHCALVGQDPAHCIRVMGRKHLQCLHIHDVDHIRDCHTMPFLEELNWASIVEALKEVGYDGNWTFEANNLFIGLPTELWEPAINLMAKTGRYFIKQMES